METKNLGERSGHQLMSLASRIKAIHHAMTADELADLLKVSRLTILGRAKRGTIPSFRVGSCLRFDPAPSPGAVLRLPDLDQAKSAVPHATTA